MTRRARYAVPLSCLIIGGGGVLAAPPASHRFTWTTVVNNGDYMPTDTCDVTAPDPPDVSCKTFNGYNPPSINSARRVVFRARSRGGQGLGQPAHGVYIRDMAGRGPVARLFDRETLVPQPNNRGGLFVEPPSFPRIDIGSSTVASRGNHQPTWASNGAGAIAEPLGTSGIYTNPFGHLITGASKLGALFAFSFFEVPERPGTPFEVFPGTPAVTNGNIIVFKGNYTADGAGRTGVYYRELLDAPVGGPDGTELTPSGGTLPVVPIANSTDTFIPGTLTLFGSTAPPSAANRTAVFAGFDNEESPTLGGIHLARLDGPRPPLSTLVRIGERVPGERAGSTFNRLGEGVSFDGRFVAFWGAWGTATKRVLLHCPTEGNKDRIAFCRQQYPDGFATRVPVRQGVFVYDTRTGQLRAVAKTPADFDDFLYWNYSGHVPGASEGGEDDGEPARWRVSAFVAVSGMVDGSLEDAGFDLAFKARTGRIVGGAYRDAVDGVYLGKGPGQSRLVPLVETGMTGTQLDPEAIDPISGAILSVTEMGLERDGFRGNALVVNVSMGNEDTGWAGIYLMVLAK